MANDLFNSFMNGPDEKGRFGKFGGQTVMTDMSLLKAILLHNTTRFVLLQQKKYVPDAYPFGILTHLEDIQLFQKVNMQPFIL